MVGIIFYNLDTRVASDASNTVPDRARRSNMNA